MVVLMETIGGGERGMRTKRTAWKRLGSLMYKWLCLLSCVSEHISAGPNSNADRASSSLRLPADPVQPDLQAQLEEILDCVRHEERIWRLENRIQGSGA